MDDRFIKKVRASAVAGWWTVLIAYGVLLIQWLVYLIIMTTQPTGVTCLWGKAVTWPEIRSIWLWAMVAYKIVLATMVFVVIWLTIWARRLAKK